MKEIAQTVAARLTEQLDDTVTAVYLYGSLAQGFYEEGESNINLLVVVDDDTDIHVVRQAFWPIWQQYGEQLRRAPLLASRTAFVRHMQLNHVLAHHIYQDGQLLLGDGALLADSLPPVKATEALAYLANEAAYVSQAVLPEVLDEESVVATNGRLRSLARRVQHAPLSPSETNRQLFARVQHFLTPLVNQLPQANVWRQVDAPPSSSLILPGLQAIYKETGTFVLVFAHLTPQQIMRIDWQQVAQHTSKDTYAVKLTTVEQLCLMVSYERPLDLSFRKYEHHWGPDFLANLTPDKRQIFRQAARLPSQVLVDSMPNAVLTQSDELLPEIIHDFQNKLLNIHLEHELMVRFGLVERFVPPEPLPGRDTPARERIVAIFQNLDWWADFYAQQIANL